MSFRRRHKGGGGGGNSALKLGFMATIFGAIGLIIAIIMFALAIGQLDTAYTTAATYTEQVGLTSVMGLWGMVIFLVFMTAGLSGIAGGAYVGVKTGLKGGWMNVFMAIVMGAVTLVITLILNTIVQGQLHSAYVTANATTNVAQFAGLLDVMEIWGMIIFITLMAAGLAPIIAAGIGGFHSIKAAA